MVSSAWPSHAHGQVGGAAQPAISFPLPSRFEEVTISAERATRWHEGQYEVLHLSGKVRLQQGSFVAQTEEAAIWLDFAEPSQEPNDKVIAFLRGNVEIDLGQRSAPRSDRIRDTQWFGRLITVAGIRILSQSDSAPTNYQPEIYLAGKRFWNQNGLQNLPSPNRPASGNPPVQSVATSNQEQWHPGGFQPGGQQFKEMRVPPPYSNLDPPRYPASTSAPVLIDPATGRTIQAVPASQQEPLQPTPILIPQDNQPESVPSNVPSSDNRTTVPPDSVPRSLSGGGRNRVRITPRNPGVESGFKVQSSDIPGEQILIATGGVQVVIDSDELGQMNSFGQRPSRQLTVVADNVIAWSNQLNFASGPQEEARWELYLEGNVIFQNGRRTIYAERMYYDVNRTRGTILDAELLTPIPQYQGLARLKADVVQQLDENHYQAYGAALTSSRLAVPRYWLQSEEMTVTSEPVASFDPINGQPLFDPITGQGIADETYFASSRDNRIYIGSLPVFYWPFLRTNLDNPSFYVERIRIGNDNVFGTQVGVGFDMFQVLGFRRPPRGVEWIGNLDYLSERGFGFGNDVTYRRDQFLGFGGNINGKLKSWFIDDDGLDNLGRGRRMVPLEEDFRGRVNWRHRHEFSPGFNVRAELGWITDRNFLEQYFEREWDTQKDQTTGIWLERNIGNQSWNLIADYNLNDFVTQTDWLPRGDHFVIGQPVFGNLVWSAHSHVGYGRFQAAEAPTNPVDLALFAPLAWETADAEGIRAGTRHELDLPFFVGPVKVVPYALGDVTYWQEDLNGDDLLRGYGQAGFRASLPMWRVDPTIHSVLFNVNGLAHKLTWDAEFGYADASQDLDTLPLYDPLNDDAQEAFQRRFQFNTFGGMIPARFDERSFAYRYGLQGYVTSPSAEIADDLTFVRLGMRNRFQTKRGFPGEARIVDWIEFDVEGTFFPRAARDNFGEEVGMVNYDFAWHIGDRVSLVSDGYFDLFSQGLRTASIGLHASRPAVADFYVGVRSIEGPISSSLISAATTYRASDKWIFRAGSTLDLGSTGNIGQSFHAIRVGESFLVRVGVNYNVSRGNTGFVLGIEPRFLPRKRFGRVGGVAVPPASSEYLE